MSVNIRANLKPQQRKDRGKWYPRGSWAYKDEQGGIRRKRDYHGPGSDTRTVCQEDCDRLNRELEEAVKSGPLAPTFEEAVETYLGSGGDPRFLGEIENGPRNRLLDFLGQYRVDAIDDAIMTRAATALYPTAKPITVNRQLYTPVITVLRLAAKGQNWKPDLKRPKGWWRLKPARPPENSWFDLVRPKCRPQLWALLLFCTIHGRRAGDAIRLEPEDFNLVERTALIERTKNGDPLLVRLADQVVEAILAYNWQAGPGLFGHYTLENRRNLFRDLKAACERAEVKYYTPHKAGRHAFAKRLLDAGKSLKHLKEAGRWENITVPAMLYGHLEHSEVDDETRRIGEGWASNLGKSKDNIVQIKRQNGARG